MTSLSSWLDVPTEVQVCRSCGHVQSPNLPDVQAFYDHEYRISLQSDDHDQLYELSPSGPVFRTAHQAAILAGLDVPQGARMLDFGAAKATTTRRFLQQRPDLQPHVFDVSEDYRSYWADWVPVDAQATYSLPTDWHGRFDLITAHFVLEHVTEPGPVLANLASFLAPGGRLFFTVPDPIGNPGDLLVADHLNHFVPSSIHAALAASGLRAVWIRQELFRGAHAVLAEVGPAAGHGTPTEDVKASLELLSDWQAMFSGLSNALAEPATAQARVAIYGAGFYGALFRPLVGPKLECFLDRNPHLQGGTLEGLPILAPEACPPVQLVIVALNPTRARAILPPDTPWLPEGARVLYPGDAVS
jgi:SAM-dependent methyltransferase